MFRRVLHSVYALGVPEYIPGYPGTTRVLECLHGIYVTETAKFGTPGVPQSIYLSTLPNTSYVALAKFLAKVFAVMCLSVGGSVCFSAEEIGWGALVEFMIWHGVFFFSHDTADDRCWCSVAQLTTDEVYRRCYYLWAECFSLQFYRRECGHCPSSSMAEGGRGMTIWLECLLSAPRRWPLFSAVLQCTAPVYPMVVF